MGEFGFSIVGAVFLVALFVPNIVWGLAARPAGYDPTTENRALQLVERIGQVLTTAAALLFADTNLRPWSPWSWWLVAAVVLMVAYEAAWIRYFVSRRTLRDFYRGLLGVPLPLATLPIGAFLLLGVYGRLLPLIVATIVLDRPHRHPSAALPRARAVTADDDALRTDGRSRALRGEWRGCPQ